MAESETSTPPSSSPSTPPPDSSTSESSSAPAAAPEILPASAYLVSTAEDLKSAVRHSTDSAIGSARFLQQTSSSHIRTLQDFIPEAVSHYRTYEDAVVKKVKDELASAREHPAAAVGIALTAGLFMMRGPRRFLFRQTLGRLQSEEARYAKAEKSLKELNLSVNLMKKESQKLLERAGLAEKDMKYGHDELVNTGRQIQQLAKTAYKVESEATDLMDRLRDMPGRESLTLRAEVASMASFLKKQRNALNKRIMKISELGVPV